MPFKTARRAAQMSPILFALASGAYAQTGDAADHRGDEIPSPAAEASTSPGSEDMMSAMDKMQQSMTMEMTGDADVDFARGMIAHHQGAIEMAKVLLERGDDPEMRALAETVIAAQQTEIEKMETWLKANPPAN